MTEAELVKKVKAVRANVDDDHARLQLVTAMRETDWGTYKEFRNELANLLDELPDEFDDWLSEVDDTIGQVTVTVDWQRYGNTPPDQIEELGEKYNMEFLGGGMMLGSGRYDLDYQGSRQDAKKFVTAVKRLKMKGVMVE